MGDAEHVLDCNVLPIQHLRPSETNKKTNQLLTHCCMSPRSALLGICTFPIFSGIKLILYNSYLNPIHNHKTHIFHLFLVLIAHT